MQFSNRMQYFQTGIFSVLAQMKNERFAQGKQVIDLSVGTPNIPPTPHVRQVLSEAALAPENYVYSIRDIPALREAAAAWYKRRFGVTLDPWSEITSLAGSQDGLAHIALAIADPGDIVLVPDPCYPAFAAGAQLSGAQVQYMPQRRENGFLIDFDEIPEDIALKAKLMVVSYPNNPTTAVAPDSFYHKLIAFAQKYNIIVLHDNAYSELVFDGKQVGSFLAHPGAMEVGVEFNSLSKSCGIAGARVGFCLGNRAVCKNLEILKSNIDYGIFLPVQMAAVAALTGDQTCIAETCAAYERRRNILCDGLTAAGWQVTRPEATMFIWAKLPEGHNSSEEFVKLLFERSGVLLTPGSAFGTMGEGHVRIALVQEEDALRRAVNAVAECGILL